MTTVYCQQCGHSLQPEQTSSASMWSCPACNHVHYQDPKVAVGVLVGDGRRVLLTLRNHEPRSGYWSFPAGFVDRAEDVEQAAVREVREETGLHVVIEGLIGVYSQAGDPVIFIVYEGREVGGELHAGDEADDAAYFPVESLPPLAFPHDVEIVDAWRQRSALSVK